MRFVRLVAVVALFLSGVHLFAPVSRAADDVIPSDAVQVELIRVIDGDTIDVDFDLGPGEDRDRIRMIGIDTPETNYSYGNEPECYGEEASKKTDSLLVASSEIWVERDEDPVDNNDRLLRYVWYISEIDGKVHLLNEQLVAEGYATARYYAPNGLYQDRLDAAQDNAIREGRGMWTACDASVSLDPNLEDDNVPDTAPIDRTKTPVSDEEEICSFFDTWDEAYDFWLEFPELDSDFDPDGNGIPCDRYFDIGS
ncbi:MAG: thermonuclease family protein [Thermomicrobiales bacterium]